MALICGHTAAIPPPPRPAFLPAIAYRDPVRDPANRQLGIEKVSAALTFPMPSQRFPFTFTRLGRRLV